MNFVIVTATVALLLAARACCLDPHVPAAVSCVCAGDVQDANRLCRVMTNRFGNGASRVA